MWREKRGAIFDMDGTLMASMWMWKYIDIEYLDRFGFELPPDLQHAIEMESDWNQMAMEFYQTRVHLKKGARELLDAMKARGMKLGIATSNSMPLTTAALRANGLEEAFDTVRSAAEVAHGKPSPDIYLSVAQEWGMKAEDIIVFEDIPKGALAGKRAGMEVVAVEDPWAESRREELKTIADYYIRDFTELI